jgi:hypothetical protein
MGDRSAAMALKAATVMAMRVVAEHAAHALTRISEARRSAWLRAKVECRRSLDGFGAESDERGP